jgi:methyl-accepting chemotaxis protein
MELSTRTEQTASSLQRTASHLEHLTGTVTESTEVAQEAADSAAAAAASAERGGTVMVDVVSNMASIAGSSNKIADIIGVIDGIAFQTNILALNAAVEAARAGEHGRGFAVVASEVRALAGRSAQAAKEITALIGASEAAVRSGSQQVELAKDVMQEIVASVRDVSRLLGEVALTARGQRDGINQVNQAVVDIDRMTQQNAALVEESSAAASALSDQARRLSETVSVFKIVQVSPAP